MEENDKSCLILVQRGNNGQVTVEVAGNGLAILANWAIVTSDICERLHIPPVVLAGMMPGMIMRARSRTDGRVTVDLDAIRRAKEGGHGAGK